MVVFVEARKLNLPHGPSSSSSSSSAISPPTSLLYDSSSLSLALTHSDSSVSLYPSFSPSTISSSSIPHPQTLIPAPSSSACFIHLKARPNSPSSRVVFLAAGPNSNGEPKILLRFYILLKSQKFAKAQLNCNQSGLNFVSKSGVVVDGIHGTKVVLAGSVNYFAMYSSSADKVWIFGLKMVGNVDEGISLRLVKCAVINCCYPITTINITMGFLMLQELNGVRLFVLRKLVKGNKKKEKNKGLVGREVAALSEGLQNKVNVGGKNSKLPNGITKSYSQSSELDKKYGALSKIKADAHAPDEIKRISSNDLLVSSFQASHEPVKLQILKLRQDSSDSGACFVPFGKSTVESADWQVSEDFVTKAVTAQAFSQNRFLIVDPSGNLHDMHVSSSGTLHIARLTGTMQSQQLAVFPDMSNSSKIVWLSDGCHSVHVMEVSEVETSTEENDGNTSDAKLEMSVLAAIFTGGKIQDTAALAANAILILGQDCLYVYAIS